MIMSLLLFENEFLNIVSISFTALVLNELIMVAVQITTWHVCSYWIFRIFQIDCPLYRHAYMILAEIVTLIIYAISIVFLPEYFGAQIWAVSIRYNPDDHINFLMALDLTFVTTLRFSWKVLVTVAVSSLPLYLGKLIRSRISPAISSKLL